MNRSGGALLLCLAVLGAAANAEEVYGVRRNGALYEFKSLSTVAGAAARDLGAVPDRGGREIVGLVPLGPARGLALVRSGEQADALLEGVGIPGAWHGTDAATLPSSVGQGSVTAIAAFGTGYALLVGSATDTPPYQLVTVVGQDGAFRADRSLLLPPMTRFSHLASCPDGSLYAIAQSAEHRPRMARIKPAEGAVELLPAIAAGTRDRLEGLACGSEGFYVLAGTGRERALYRLRPETGGVTRIAPFAVDHLHAGNGPVGAR